ncbi:MAG TPA: hypothetical protein VLH56_11785 [Dissulfurispiraceae bacterium]|nr:hypothetical protein [Dissulfurispiraceae bacterium]
MKYIGIDPGQSGGMVLLSDSGEVCQTAAFAKMTERDIFDTLHEWSEGACACLESVHSMPRQGVASSFKFGTNYGFLRGVLTATGIQWKTATPQQWQKELGCLTKGDKNITKAAAQRRWPNTKWTHATADAALIAEFCRRGTA